MKQQESPTPFESFSREQAQNQGSACIIYIYISAYLNTPNEKHSKLDSKSKKFISEGYEGESNI